MIRIVRYLVKFFNNNQNEKLLNNLKNFDKRKK